MNVLLECEASIHIDAHKDIAKIIKWCDKNYSTYFKIINQVSNGVLVTNTSKVSAPTWYSFESLNYVGETEKFEPIITDAVLKSQLYGLANKAKGFNYTVETFDTQPTGIYPYFVFNRKDYAYCIVIDRDNSVDIHVSKIN
jgi:hypothetical protein